jgi:cell division protein FtsQ
MTGRRSPSRRPVRNGNVIDLRVRPESWSLGAADDWHDEDWGDREWVPSDNEDPDDAETRPDERPARSRGPRTVRPKRSATRGVVDVVDQPAHDHDLSDHEPLDLFDVIGAPGDEADHELDSDVDEFDAEFDAADRRSAAARIDERMRARRIAVKRKAGRRRLRRLIALVMVGAVIWTVWFSSLAQVDEVRVTGASNTSADAIVAASGLLGARVLRADLDGATRRIAALPYVDQVTVQRSLPNDIDVTVSERSPVAVLGLADGRWMTTDRTGRLLEVLDTRPPDLPRIGGPGPNAGPGGSLPSIAEAAVRVAETLPPVLFGRIERVMWDERGEATAVLLTETTVRYGLARQVKLANVSLLTVLDQRGTAPTVEIDLRAPADPVVTPG